LTGTRVINLWESFQLLPHPDRREHRLEAELDALSTILCSCAEGEIKIQTGQMGKRRIRI
jgi:hypothetical protein